MQDGPDNDRLDFLTGQRCPNCSAELSGPYCSSCGQRQIDLDRPFREIASEVMEAFFSFDERLIRTLWPLIARPGFLTQEYLEGRRARYLHPFKLYFAFSVILFLVISLSGYTVVRITNGEENEVIAIGSGESEGGVTDSEAITLPEDPSLVDRLFAPLIRLAEDDLFVAVAVVMPREDEDSIANGEDADEAPAESSPDVPEVEGEAASEDPDLSGSE